jgi:hypothetical protein
VSCQHNAVLERQKRELRSAQIMAGAGPPGLWPESYEVKHLGISAVASVLKALFPQPGPESDRIETSNQNRTTL